VYAQGRLRALDAVKPEDPFVAVVRHMVESDPHGPPSVHRLSRGMAMSARTLERRLNERNSGYRVIVEAWRRSKAQELLLETTVSLDEIGQRLGYSEPSNFSRAVRRWFGCSPGRLRATRPQGTLEHRSQHLPARDRPDAQV
jgi:AraC-like DNA-binding protein